MLTVAGAAAGETHGGIVFAPDGRASGGRIEIGDRQQRLQASGDWLNGRVSIADAR